MPLRVVPAGYVPGLLRFFLHGVAAHFNPVRIVNQPVQDSISYSRISDRFMPTCDGHLRSQNHAPDLIALLADFPEVTSFVFGERRHCPVINHQNIDTADSGKHLAKTAIGAGEGELWKQGCGPRVERRVPIPAGFLR